MKTRVIVPMLSILVLSGCMVAPRSGGRVDIIPFLPVTVEIESDNYYAHGGYHYFYDNDHWYYSASRDGRRSELPRSHWPKETHRRGRGHR